MDASYVCAAAGFGVLTMEGGFRSRRANLFRNQHLGRIGNHSKGTNHLLNVDPTGDAAETLPQGHCLALASTLSNPPLLLVSVSFASILSCLCSPSVIGTA